jgi:hypothetical protein
LLREFSLLTLLVEYLDGLSRLLNLAAGLGHRVQLGSRLRLAAAGAEANGASYGKNKSCYFHKKNIVWKLSMTVKHNFRQQSTLK